MATANCSASTGDSSIGFPSVLAVIDPLTGNITASYVIGEYFGGGAVAPLQYTLTGLTYGNGELYGVYQDTNIGFPAVLAELDLMGAVQSTSIIGEYFSGGSLAPLQYPVTGLAFVDDAVTPTPPGTVPEPTSALLLLVGGAALVARNRRR